MDISHHHCITSACNINVSMGHLDGSALVMHSVASAR